VNLKEKRIGEGKAVGNLKKKQGLLADLKGVGAYNAKKQRNFHEPKEGKREQKKTIPNLHAIKQRRKRPKTLNWVKVDVTNLAKKTQKNIVWGGQKGLEGQP